MLRDHRPLLVAFADKSAVRDYVAARVGSQYLPTSLGILDDPQDLRELPLPVGYVVKPTHGSGAAIVVSPHAPADARLPPPRWSWVYCQVHPSVVSAHELADIGRHWLSQLYGQGPNQEWAYGQIRPRIIVEELLSGPDFVRVDLYHLPDRIVFGELTSYPGGGDGPFHPEYFDDEFGRWWTVPHHYE